MSSFKYSQPVPGRLCDTARHTKGVSCMFGNDESLLSITEFKCPTFQSLTKDHIGRFSLNVIKCIYFLHILYYLCF